MSGDLTLLERVRDRIIAGEPVRLLIGHRFHDSAEIMPAPRFADRVRAALLADIRVQIAALNAPPTEED